MPSAKGSLLHTLRLAAMMITNDEQDHVPGERFCFMRLNEPIIARISDILSRCDGIAIIDKAEL